MFLRRPQALVAPRPLFLDEVWRARCARQTSSFPLEWEGETRPCGAGNSGDADRSILAGLNLREHLRPDLLIEVEAFA